MLLATLYLLSAFGLAAIQISAVRRATLRNDVAYATESVSTTAVLGIVASVLCYASAWLLLGVAFFGICAISFMSWRLRVDDKGFLLDTSDQKKTISANQIASVKVAFQEHEAVVSVSELQVTMRDGEVHDLSWFDVHSAWLRLATQHLSLSDEQRKQMGQCQKHERENALIFTIVLLVISVALFVVFIKEGFGWWEVPRLMN